MPLALVVLNSFNADRTFAWPPTELTLHWWDVGRAQPGRPDALWISVEVGAAGDR